MMRGRVDPEHRDRGEEESSSPLRSARFRVVRLLPVRGAGAVLRGAVLPTGQPDRRAARRLSPRMPPASSCVPSARSCSAGSATSSDANTRSSSPSSSWARRRSSSACCRRTSDRLARADPDGDAAPRAGPRARRRVRRRGDLRRGARAARQARLRHGVDPDHGDAGPVPRAAHHLPVPQQHGREDFAEWGWRIPFWLSLVLLVVLDLHPAEAARVADLPEDEGRGQRLEVAADATASSSTRTTSTCCSRCSAPRPARAWSGTRASSTRCSSSRSR